MGIPVYLAMTAAELRSSGKIPTHVAWLSCLFSPYGRGISNIPKKLPPNSLLILSDRTPICGHDPNLIFETLAGALTSLSCSGLLLDFERPDIEEAAQVARVLTTLPFPVAVTARYAADLDCPVFVPAPLPNAPPSECLSLWEGREIWLELTNQSQIIAVTEQGATTSHGHANVPLPHRDSALFCHYRIDLSESSATFTLQRTQKDWEEFLASARVQITRAIALHQEFA